MPWQELQHFRAAADGSRRLLQRVLTLPNFCGYGECQQVHNVSPKEKIKLGDSLEVHCWFLNKDNRTVHYGVSNGGEMARCIFFAVVVLPDTVPEFY